MRTPRTTPVVGVVAAATFIVVGLASPALAHVTVHSTDANPGGSDAELSFRVPNEQDKASTTKVEIVLPTDAPLITAVAQTKPGWTVSITNRKLTTPVKTDDGSFDTVVATVTWTATAGGVMPGQYDDFDIAVGKLPDAKKLVFKAVQTYSDGTVVRWIEQKAPGATKDPDHPAPTLELAAASANGAPDASASSATPAPTASAATVTTAPTSSVASSKPSRTAEALGGAGLGLGAIALALAIAAFARSGRRVAGRD